ncbi:MAG: hypothetical protein H0W95_01100 [Nocardioidaceae bacterium]|nr:hypothetical protein [Nocardioidaceae bacterium]
MPPDTVNDLPLHALAVHGTVVLVPLAALLGLLFAVPRLRRWSHLPLALVALASAGSVWASVQSGEALKEAGGIGGAGLGGPVAELVEQHEELAEQLQWLVWGYALVAVVAVVLYRRSRANSDGDRAERDTGGGVAQRGGLAVTGLSVLLVLGAIAVGVQTYRVGDVGSTAVWNPTGSVDYSGSAEE